MMSDRAALVAFARDSIIRGSKSFATASRLFDPATRERAWLLYAWCRATDDIADGQDHGGTMSTNPLSAERIERIAHLTDKALAGEPTGEPAFDALRLVVAEAGIPHRYPRDLITGFRMDAADFRPQTTDDLLRYCYHVAGSVGCMMAIVMGIDASRNDILDRACDLGLAFQLANIARDIAEDAAAGRCYIPAEWLAELGIAPGEHMAPHHRDKLAMMGRRLARLATAYESSARVGAHDLPLRARWAVLSAAGIYGDIARKADHLGAHAWDQRIRTSASEKLVWMLRAGGSALINRTKSSSRESLWTRPV